LVDFVAICFILWQFGIFCGRLTYYPHFGIFSLEKSGNPVRPLRDPDVAAVLVT
jgi:hypothetical protein